ncbi:PepSY domain-containing protein [Methylobacterium nigriterrae]|uniref:PepSY domain-containing protein n=1 Tax=Methylobacterium nigriterrae TaxID=3127512 RepID=UPI003013FA38
MRISATVLFAIAGLAGASGAALADVPGKGWISKDAVTERLTAAGYTNITGLEADDGIGKARARRTESSWSSTSTRTAAL